MEGGGFECFQKFSKRNSAHFGVVIGVQAYGPSVATGLGSRRSRLNSGIGRAPCINTGRLVSRVVSLNNFSENFLRNLRLFYLNGTECSTTVLQTMIHAPPNFSLRFSTSPRRMPVVHETFTKTSIPFSYLGNFHGRMEEEKRKRREEKYVGHAKLVRSCVRFIVEKGWRVGGRPRKFRKLHFRRDETNAEEAKKSLPRYVI